MSSTTLEVSSHGFTRHIRVAARPDQVYAPVSTVSNIGKWSPDALHAEYEDGAGSREGAWFRGRNHRSGRQWESRSQVTVAEPGAAFAYTVLGSASVPVVEDPAGGLLTGGDVADREHDVRVSVSGTKTFRVPEVGDVVLGWDTCPLPGRPGPVMLVLTAEPGSADADRLHLLASLRAIRSDRKVTPPATSR